MHTLPPSEFKKPPYFWSLPQSYLGTHVLLILLLYFLQHNTYGRTWNRGTFQWSPCFYHQWCRHYRQRSHISYQIISSASPVGNFPGRYVCGRPLTLFPLIRSLAAGAVWVFRVRDRARTCAQLARTCLRVELSYCTFFVYGIHCIVSIYVVMIWRTSITTQAHARFMSILDIPRPLIN